MMKNKLLRAVSMLLILAFLFCVTCCAPVAQDNKKLRIRIEFDDSSSIFNYVIELRDVFPEYEFDFQSMVRRGHVDGTEGSQKAGVILSQMAIHEDVPDIIIADALSADLPNLTNAFAEVSGEGYTSRFQTSYLNNIAIDGKLYYLPFFVGLKGIIYNQTMFEENGWEVPQNYAEFTKLLTTIYDAGMPPISVRTMADLGTGLFSTAYLINDGATLSGYKWQKAFSTANPKAERETFTGTLPYLRMLGTVGHIADDLESFTEGIAHLMKERQVAMCIANGESLSQVYNSGTHDKFAMMPLYSQAFPDGVIIEHNTLYLGMSAKSMNDPEMAAALSRIADYIYSEKGQLRLLESCRGLVSPCYGLMDELSSPSLAAFKRVLEGGNLVEEVAPFAVDSSFGAAVLAFLSGDATEEAENELLSSLNDARALQLLEDSRMKEVLTQATETFSLQQVLNLIMQAMRTQTGSDVAVAPPSTRPDYYGHFHDTQVASTKLYEGDVTVPILESTLFHFLDVQVYTMTGAQLLSLVDINKTNNICLGMTPELTFNKEKDLYLTTGAYLADGERLDLSREYRVCVPSNISIPESGCVRAEPYGQSLMQTLASYCASQASISPFDLPEPKYIQ
ncbi:MAG: extracellular solute-binding protein [Clostridia bacterium]|nr:extracellular solute-binding protein [Clostridia bacterium]